MDKNWEDMPLKPFYIRRGETFLKTAYMRAESTSLETV
jgi:hypothetical protein